MNLVRRLAIAAFLASACAPGAAGAATPAVMQPVLTYVEAANAGDRTRLISAFTPAGEIVDEFAPYRFKAPHAAARWFDGFVADQRANGVTAATISYAAPKFLTIQGDNAYLVLPTVYTYRLHGHPAREAGSLVFSLLRRGTVWKIGTMSWAKASDTSQP